MKWYKELQFTISDGRIFHKGIVAGKRKIYKCSYEKKLGEIYTGEIHGFAKMYKVEYIVPLGLLLDHVVFYKIGIIEI